MLGSDPPRRTHYDVLGVPHDAELDVVKRAYRRLALELHPDKRAADVPEADANARFQELVDAVAAERMRYRSAALATFGPLGMACVGSWPWDAADLGDWLRPAGSDSDSAALRPIHLGSGAEEMTFTRTDSDAASTRGRYVDAVTSSPQRTLTPPFYPYPGTYLLCVTSNCERYMYDTTLTRTHLLSILPPKEP